VLKVVKGLMEDEPPAEELMKNASDFYRQRVGRILNFAAVRLDNASQAQMKKTKSKEVVLYGREALDHDMNRLDIKYTKGGTVDSKDLKLLKTFRWSLTPPQIKQFDQWQSDAIYSALVMYKRIQDKKESDDCKDDAGSALAKGSSSSSAIVPKTKLPPPPPVLKKKDRPQKELAVETKNELMKFFGKKHAS
jgi:hypothetical protein